MFQPTDARSAPPTNGTRMVPTLPPAIWVLIANPRRSGGKASDRMPLPTGCWGLAPTRAPLMAASSWPTVWEKPATTRLPPKMSCPTPISMGRATYRVSRPYDSCMAPPTAVVMAMNTPMSASSRPNWLMTAM